MNVNELPDLLRNPLRQARLHQPAGGAAYYRLDLPVSVADRLSDIIFRTSKTAQGPHPVENLMTKKWSGPVKRNLRLIVNRPANYMAASLVKAVSTFLLDDPICRSAGEYPEALAEEFRMSFMDEYYEDAKRPFSLEEYLRDAWGIECRSWFNPAETAYRVSRAYDATNRDNVKFGLVAMISRVDYPLRVAEIARMVIEHLGAVHGADNPTVVRFKLGYLTRVHLHGGDFRAYLHDWGIRIEDAYQFAGQQSVRKEGE